MSYVLYTYLYILWDNIYIRLGDYMAKKYDIVFVDIDDTLNPSDEEVSNYTKEIMKELKKNGIKVVVCTGRSLQYAINKSIEADLSEYVIASNGAEVYNYKTKESIFSKAITNKEIKSIYEFCTSHSLTIVLNSFNQRFTNNINCEDTDKPVSLINDIDEVLKNNQINQIVILGTNFNRMLIIPELFKDKYNNLNVVNSSKELVEGQKKKNKVFYHDIVANNTAKSKGIVELLDYLHLSSKNSVAIGNSYDDISMTYVVNTSVAVSNAPDKLKEVVTYVTDSAKNDGVAKILEKLCLNK